jgi:hypothetical protein
MTVVLMTFQPAPYLEPNNSILAIVESLVLVPLILFYFGVTGYLFTTVYAALKLRARSKWAYPAALAVLYFIHSQFFFIGIGNAVLSRFLVISVGGACVAFFSGALGNRLIARRSGDVSLGALKTVKSDPA